MVTTVQISDELHKELSKLKMSDRETYESIIWDLLEDRMEINEQTRKEIKEARAEIAAGKGIPLSEVKKRLGMPDV